MKYCLYVEIDLFVSEIIGSTGFILKTEFETSYHKKV